MIVKMKRLSHISVSLEMTSSSKKLKMYDSIPHSLGNIEQAQLFILAQAREWDETDIIVETDKSEDFTLRMYDFGRTIVPYRGKISIKTKQEDGVIQEV